ncbi:hypothetical protein CYMTET_21413 [Cymbomonas tetramitiformis]|uniref:Uncharacterized protein n=1 Tax=Cymbomonas tetramitiformis TaxID=36881 RepID=A0AAE0G237_9CHLO|nr:hypothetical protein CYMTET_21413 [Cymbomonas tetramitiformis]
MNRSISKFSVQLPRYYAAWKDPLCEGVDSLVYVWRRENNWVNPPWALLDEVAHKLREEEAAATVVVPYWPAQSWLRGLVMMPRCKDLFIPCRLRGSELRGPSKWDVVLFRIEAPVLHDDGDEKTLELSEENFKNLCSSGVEDLNNDEAALDSADMDEGIYEEIKHGAGGIKSTSLQPYLSAINNYHEELGLPGPAKESAVNRAVEGMATIPAQLAVQVKNIETQRTWLPARHVDSLEQNYKNSA